ncbi:hypothetical protein L2E82_27553 [Cichorium intybus]|uniref:Uncharacterized protein n=1 Tax=Cichorium intybus TaxID=13427 RepID=A0ACB9CTX3_CICIN|nr:hypothetical protein L2E82_27553 [Cichorium intybus]
MNEGMITDYSSSEENNDEDDEPFVDPMSQPATYKDNCMLPDQLAGNGGAATVSTPANENTLQRSHSFPTVNGEHAATDTYISSINGEA